MGRWGSDTVLILVPCIKEERDEKFYDFNTNIWPNRKWLKENIKDCEKVETYIQYIQDLQGLQGQEMTDNEAPDDDTGDDIDGPDDGKDP